MFSSHSLKNITVCFIEVFFFLITKPLYIDINSVEQQQNFSSSLKGENAAFPFESVPLGANVSSIWNQNDFENTTLQTDFECLTHIGRHQAPSFLTINKAAG